MQVDYIIVGAGSAGCVLANRLSANPQNRVLLLEAGMPDKKPEIHIPGAYGLLHKTKVDWQFWTEPQKHVDGRRIYLPRGKTLGGSSSTNAMAYVRGNRHDFDEWAAFGNKGWGYDDVLPYFKKSESNEQIHDFYHGNDGPFHISYAQSPSVLAETFVKACAESGISENGDYNGAEQIGSHLLQFNIRDGKRHSAAAAFLKPVMHRKNLIVQTGCQVLRVLIEQGKATGVEYRQGDQLRTATCEQEVILSAGAFQSPQILLLSGIGDGTALQTLGLTTLHHLPGVGKNLQDHVWSGVMCSSDLPSGNSLLKPWNMARILLQHLLLKSGPLANSPLEANAFYATDQQSRRPDIQFHFVPLGVKSDYSTDIYDQKTFPWADGFSVLSILLHPKSRGEVSLRTADPLAAPRIQPNLLSDPEDLALLLKGMRKALQIAQAPALASISSRGVYLPKQRSEEQEWIIHIKKSLETLYHPVGTCKMGNDDSAVVDDHLRVHGVGQLRVADASIMPTITSGNTNAATIMIGEKAADLILQQA